jgi:ubiquinone/menaquinone biosynthesis C-methylase UbiE
MSAEKCEDWVRDVFMHRYVVGCGDIVLDIGAGSGTEVLPESWMVGRSGEVIAVDAHPATFAALERLSIKPPEQRRADATGCHGLQSTDNDK